MAILAATFGNRKPRNLSGDADDFTGSILNHGDPIPVDWLDGIFNPLKGGAQFRPNLSPPPARSLCPAVPRASMRSSCGPVAVPVSVAPIQRNCGGSIFAQPRGIRGLGSGGGGSRTHDLSGAGVAPNTLVLLALRLRKGVNRAGRCGSYCDGMAIHGAAGVSVPLPIWRRMEFSWVRRV